MYLYLMEYNIDIEEYKQKQIDEICSGILKACYTDGIDSISDIQVQLTPQDLHEYLKYLPIKQDLPTDIKIPILRSAVINSFDELVQLWDISSIEEGLFPLKHTQYIYFLETGESLTMILPIQLDNKTTNIHISNVGEERPNFIQYLYEQSVSKKPDLKLVQYH